MMREGEPLMGSFHTRKLSFLLQCVLLSFFSRLAIRGACSREEVCCTPNRRDQPPCLFPVPGARGTWLPGRATYAPKETREEAERRSQPTARLRKPAPLPALGRGPVVLEGSA